MNARAQAPARKPRARLLRDLPGWQEASVAARRVENLMPSAVTAAGLFAAPASLDHVSVELITCLALGIESQRNRDRWKRRERAGNVVSLSRARIARDLERNGRSILGYAFDDPATWTAQRGPAAFTAAARAANYGELPQLNPAPVVGLGLWELPEPVRRAAMAVVYLYGYRVDQVVGAAHQTWARADESTRRNGQYAEDWMLKIWKLLPNGEPVRQRGRAPARRSSL